MSDLIDLLIKAATSPGDHDTISILRRRADEVLAALAEDSARERLDHAVDWHRWHADWLATIYEAISCDVGSLASQASFYSHGDEDKDIGSAVSDVLLPALPTRLAQLEHWLVNVRDLGSKHV